MTFPLFFGYLLQILIESRRLRSLINHTTEGIGMGFVVSKNTRDRELEKEGTWFEFDEGIELLVARNNNPGYKLFLKKKYTANESAIKRDNARSTSLSEGIMLEALATHLVLDWKGFIDGDGDEIKYTSAIGKSVFEEHDDLKDSILEFAADRDNYIKAHEEETLEELKK